MVAGEISTQAKLDYDEVVRGAVKGIGYDRYDDNRVQAMMVLSPPLRASRTMSVVHKWRVSSQHREGRGQLSREGFAPTIVFDYCCGDVTVWVTCTACVSQNVKVALTIVDAIFKCHSNVDVKVCSA